MNKIILLALLITLIKSVYSDVKVTPAYAKCLLYNNENILKGVIQLSQNGINSLLFIKGYINLYKVINNIDEEYEHSKDEPIILYNFNYYILKIHNNKINNNYNNTCTHLGNVFSLKYNDNEDNIAGYIGLVKVGSYNIFVLSDGISSLYGDEFNIIGKSFALYKVPNDNMLDLIELSKNNNLTINDYLDSKYYNYDKTPVLCGNIEIDIDTNNFHNLINKYFVNNTLISKVKSLVNINKFVFIIVATIFFEI